MEPSPGHIRCRQHQGLWGGREGVGHCRDFGGGGVGFVREKENHYQRGQNYYKKNSLQTYFLEAIHFVMIAKTLCIQLKQTRERPQKYYKNSCFREFFCNNFGQEITTLEKPRECTKARRILRPSSGDDSRGWRCGSGWCGLGRSPKNGTHSFCASPSLEL